MDRKQISSEAPAFSMRTVAQRTGLTPFVIRAWEKRYNLLEPSRSHGGHRLYTEADVQRLQLLARVVKTGLPIGSVAHLSGEKLEAILAQSEQAGFVQKSATLRQDSVSRLTERAMEAVGGLDARELNQILDQGKVALGWQGLIEKLISPLATKIGQLWLDGEISISQEHFFTAVVKFHLGMRVHSYSQVKNGPRIVVATPAGQLHELGAVVVANAAANLGWEVAYLGAGLPSEELAGAVARFRASVLVISILFPENDPTLREELKNLGRLVPEGTRIIAGGRAAQSYEDVLKGIGAILVGPLSDFCSLLVRIRAEQSERLPITKSQPR